MKLLLGKTARQMGIQAQYLARDLYRPETGLEGYSPENYHSLDAWVESSSLRPYWKRRFRIGNIDIEQYKIAIRGLREAERNSEYYFSQNS